MFIQTETTPNPATLKFLPGCTLMEHGTANFPSADSAICSPLAQKLFGINGVTGVYIGGDFITIAKIDALEWHVLKPPILGALMEHITAGLPVIEPDGTEETIVDDDEVVTQIRELIDTRVRPAVAQDGGDIVFDSFRDGVVYLHMQGACAGCPSSSATLKNGVENMLRHYVPEVVRVEGMQ